MSWIYILYIDFVVHKHQKVVSDVLCDLCYSLKKKLKRRIRNPTEENVIRDFEQCKKVFQVLMCHVVKLPFPVSYKKNHHQMNVIVELTTKTIN